MFWGGGGRHRTVWLYGEHTGGGFVEWWYDGGKIVLSMFGKVRTFARPIRENIAYDGTGNTVILEIILDFFENRHLYFGWRLCYDTPYSARDSG